MILRRLREIIRKLAKEFFGCYGKGSLHRMFHLANKGSRTGSGLLRGDVALPGREKEVGLVAVLAGVEVVVAAAHGK